MKRNKSIDIIVSSLCFLLFFTACKEEWDNHYNEDTEMTGTDLYSTMLSDSTLSRFARMIEISGLKDVVSGKGTFTVFAPVNSALESIPLENLSQTDSASIQLLVKNMLAPSLSSSSVAYLGEKRVWMIDGKYVSFVRNGENSYTFGGVSFVSMDKVCSNGVLHSLSGVVAYKQNSFEMIKNDPDFSLLYTYLNRFDSTYMDPLRSVKIGMNENGFNVYDTVYIQMNKLLANPYRYTFPFNIRRGLGVIYNEDSIYTMVVPTNEAYQSAYDMYKEYFKSNGGLSGKEDAVKIQDSLTNMAIFKDLIYRGKYDSFVNKDSLTSTSYSVFYDFKSMFNGERIEVSNGDFFKTNQLVRDIHRSFYKNLTNQAEYLDADHIYAEIGTAIGYQSYPPNPELVNQVSYGYMIVREASTLLRPIVNLYFDNYDDSIRTNVDITKRVLSAKYDIYCKIVSANAEDSTLVTEKTKLNFELVYNIGSRVTKVPLLTGYITKETEVEEVLVGEDVEIPTFDGKPGLRITVDVTKATAEFAKRVRIDLIRLVAKQ